MYTAYYILYISGPISSVHILLLLFGITKVTWPTRCQSRFDDNPAEEKKKK